MKKDMLELCAWVIDQAKKAGAKDCRTRFTRTRAVEIGYRERKPETITESTNQSLSPAVVRRRPLFVAKHRRSPENRAQ